MDARTQTRTDGSEDVASHTDRRRDEDQQSRKLVEAVRHHAQREARDQIAARRDPQADEPLAQRCALRAPVTEDRCERARRTEGCSTGCPSCAGRALRDARGPAGSVRGPGPGRPRPKGEGAPTAPRPAQGRRRFRPVDPVRGRWVHRAPPLDLPSWTLSSGRTHQCTQEAWHQALFPDGAGRCLFRHFGLDGKRGGNGRFRCPGGYAPVHRIRPQR